LYQNLLELPDISIIIVNYKGWKRLKQCLDSLKLIKDNRFSHEGIIIDNLSNDGQIEVFIKLYPAFTFIVNSGNLGFASGCNLGAANSQGSFLLFLNPDTIISADALFNLLKEVRNRKEFSVISCGQVNEDGSMERLHRVFLSVFTATGWLRALNRLIHRHKEKLFYQTGDYLYPDWVSGSVIMISRESFNGLCGWDEDFWMYYEDVDLCRRAKQRNGEIVILKNTTIEHNHGGSSRINLQTSALTKTEVNISRHIFISKHERGWRAVFIHSILILDNMVLGLPVAIAGTLFFFIRRLNLKSRVYFKLANYYLESIHSQTWLSKRSVNYNRKIILTH